MLLEGRVETVEHRLDRAAEVVKTISQQQQATQEDLADLRELVDELADQVKALPAPGETRLTPEQKATIRGLVEDLVAAADARGAKLWGGKNNYQAAYATLNRTFNVAKYEELTQAQYPKAVEWLKREIARIEAQS
jgi:polyhydroxyalkanoate synthesis regulator phasin